MQILVLNGSPHPHGNTAAMVEAFQRGAAENGHTVTVVNVCQKKIAGCLACESCHQEGSGHERQCVQKDDMQAVYPLLDESEMIVLASPIYYHGFSGQLQCAINRIYALDKPKKLKKAALILSSGSDHVYSGAIYIIYGCISIIASTYVMHMMMQNFITRARLRYVAENDQTTGLRNRNAFEREQNDIPDRCRRTLSCVYMDINGLHELNNAKGHQAGDIMLREVADELKKQFGNELTYRMGGDEYVAFAPDLSEDRLHDKVRAFSLAIEQKDYHAALGWATCETASLRMENLPFPMPA